MTSVQGTQVDDLKKQDDVVEDVRQGLPPEESRRLLRKIDCCLLPFMAVSYMFQFLDKAALSFTAILGIRQDLHLSGEDYSWANGIYYFGYLLASFPASWIMVRWRVGKLIATSIFVWGVILMTTATAHNAAGLLTNRFFLGLSESAVAPGLSVVISMWYKRSEQPLRHAGWFVGNSFAGILGGFMAYGIGHIESIAAWKAIFLIFGGVTVAWSVIIVFLLPDVPMTAWFLSKADRTKAVVRVDENMTGMKNNEFKWGQVKECLLEVKTWLIVLVMLSCVIPNGGIGAFGTIVIKGFGFSTFNTLLLQSGKYLAQLAGIVLCTAGSTYFHNTRTYWMVWNFSLAITGTCLIRQLSDSRRWGRYAGYCLLEAFAGNTPLLLSLVSGNYGGFTKKTTMNALVFMAYCVGNIIGPQFFFADQFPSYPSGFLGVMISFSAGLGLTLVLRLWLTRENRLRDRAGNATEVEFVEGSTLVNFLDKTDKQIPEFRYEM